MNPLLTGQEPTFHRTPQWLRDELGLYIAKGVRPGDFLFAVLVRDYREALQVNDKVSVEAMREVTGVLFQFTQCWGDTDSVHRWMAHQGLEGWADTTESDRCMRAQQRRLWPEHQQPT